MELLESPPTEALLLSSSVRGYISELKAEIHLLERGYEVARPGVDTGVDLIVDGRLRVQVKSCAGLRQSANGNVRWEFEFRVARKDGNRDATNAERLRSYPVDFFIFHGRDIDAWWVVSAEEVGGMGRVRVTPDSERDRLWRDAWDLLR